MVEMKKKYSMGVRHFGYFNYIGAYHLYYKEVNRFLIVWAQTIFSPLSSGLLFLFVLTTAIGDERSQVFGFSYIIFLAPGLIAMQIIQPPFAHSSSSIMMGKMQLTIVDILFAPLSALEVTLAIILAAVTRSLIIILVSIIIFLIFIDLPIKNIPLICFYAIISSFILGSVGFCCGLWADKFDNMATITNFLITPLAFLSGTFYSIEKLPLSLQMISKANPFFYMIDGFRYGFLGVSDGSIFFGSIYLIILAFFSWLLSYYLFKIGYKIKS